MVFIFSTTHLLRVLSVATVALFNLFPFASAVPFSIPFSPNVFGEDGPWYGVVISVKDKEHVLYPGSFWASRIPEVEVYPCPRGRTCTQKGTRTFELETFEDRDIHGQSIYTYRETDRLEGIMNYKEEGMYFRDMKIRGQEFRNSSIFIARNTTIVGYRDSEVENERLTVIGAFSLGNPLVADEDIQDSNPELINDYQNSFPMNRLEERNEIRSRSWSMHLGSTNAAILQEPSLIFGGYDRTRIASELMVVPRGELHYLDHRLEEIKIDVMEGDMPIRDLKKGSMTKNPEDIIGSKGLPIVFDATVPYLYFPKEICDAMVDRLPVRYDEEHNYYLWDVKDKDYRIVNSTAYYTFRFAGGLELKLPLKLLDLTIVQPLYPKAASAKYFPCRPIAKPQFSEFYTIGRAFFQGMFFAMNWEQDKYMVGQAAGPAARGLRPEILSIDRTQTILSKGNLTWEESWAGHMEVWEGGKVVRMLGAGKKSTPSNSTDPSDSANNDDDGKTGEGSGNADGEKKEDEDGLTQPAKIAIASSSSFFVVMVVVIGLALKPKGQNIVVTIRQAGPWKRYFARVDPEDKFSVSSDSENEPVGGRYPHEQPKDYTNSDLNASRGDYDSSRIQQVYYYPFPLNPAPPPAPPTRSGTPGSRQEYWGPNAVGYYGPPGPGSDIYSNAKDSDVEQGSSFRGTQGHSTPPVAPRVRVLEVPPSTDLLDRLSRAELAHQRSMRRPRMSADEQPYPAVPEMSSIDLRTPHPQEDTLQSRDFDTLGGPTYASTAYSNLSSVIPADSNTISDSHLAYNYPHPPPNRPSRSRTYSHSSSVPRTDSEFYTVPLCAELEAREIRYFKPAKTF